MMKRSALSKAISGALGAVLLVIAGCAPHRSPSIELPRPTGPYAIGTTDIYLVDTEREETFTPEPSDHREVALRVWYPAEVPEEGRPVSYMEYAQEKKRALSGRTPFPPSAFHELDRVRSHSYRDAGLPMGQGLFPILIFSHGYAAGMTQSTVLMEELASHGYVVVSVGHAYETSHFVRPDGTIKVFDPQNEELLLRAKERGDALPIQQAISKTEDRQEVEALLRALASRRPKTLESLEIWVQDISFVIDELEGMNREAGIFHGRLDTGRIGVLGHSFGGSAAGQACLIDDRCRAGVNIDGLQLGDLLERNLMRPFMFIHHDNLEAPNKMPNRLFFERAEGPAYLVLVAGTRHFNFSDMSLPGFGELLGLPPEALGTIDGLRCLRIQNDYIRAFFDKHLSGRDSGLLDGPSPDYPEVEISVRNADRDYEPSPALTSGHWLTVREVSASRFDASA
jgi:predicted dienelactone hydrolase